MKEVDGEGQEGKGRREMSSQRERAMSMTVDDYEWTQNLSHEVCGVISVEQCALCADSTHDVHHAIVGVNVVIGVLVVHCELLVVRVVPLVVCDDAVVRRTLVLIAVAVAFGFVVAIFHRILLYWRYSVYSFRVGELYRYGLAALSTCSKSHLRAIQPHQSTHDVVVVVTATRPHHHLVVAAFGEFRVS